MSSENKCFNMYVSRCFEEGLNIHIQDLRRKVMLCKPPQSHSVIVLNCAPDTGRYQGLFLYFFE